MHFLGMAGQPRRVADYPELSKLNEVIDLTKIPAPAYALKVRDPKTNEEIFVEIHTKGSGPFSYDFTNDHLNMFEF